MRHRAVMRGTTLLDVLAAIALLAGTVAGTAGLLTLAARQIASAGNTTHALAVARDILERTHDWSARRLARALRCDQELPACEVSFASGDTSPEIGAMEFGVVGGRAELRLDALDASSLVGATAVRVTVRVSWTERARRRRVHLVSVKG